MTKSDLNENLTTAQDRDADGPASDSKRENVSRNWLRSFMLLGIGFAIGVFFSRWQFDDSQNSSDPTSSDAASAAARFDPGIETGEASSVLDANAKREMTMADVIQRAQGIRQAMNQSLNDYTATFEKIEADDSGDLGTPTTMEMKVQTKMRSEDDDAPMRVFLRYVSPESKAGRKVLWGEDLYEGKLAVHEVGMLLSLKTFWLAPDGPIAMQGQRYPISEIGLAKLVDKLIKRGGKDVGNPDVNVTQQTNYDFEGKTMERIVVRRTKPSDDQDDFAIAEIVVDPERNLIVQYRSYDWPSSTDQSEANQSEADEMGEDENYPLIESYTYKNLKVNVGLTDEDFDVKNPEYAYPAF